MRIPEKIKTIGSFIIVGAILILPFVVKVPEKPKPGAIFSPYTHMLTIGDTTLKVAIAYTEKEKSQGLSGSAPLGPTEGMLFVFDNDEIPSFWMKDMSYPLDMIWIDSTLHVSEITKNIPPESYPAQFTPSHPIRFMLEAPAGFSDMHAIGVGTAVSF